MALRMKDGLAEYKQGFSKRVATFAAVFVVGAVVGAWVFGDVTSEDLNQDWAGEVAIFHVIDASSSIPPLKISKTWLRLNFDLQNPIESWTLQNSAELEIDGVSTLRLDYTQDTVMPISLYVVETLKADLSEPVVGLRQGMQAATWTKSGFDFLLIGDTGAQVIWDAAKELSAR